MTEKELRERIASAVGDVDLSDTDIPSIDLYLDQILSLVSEKNAVSTPRYHDRLLTKTMVNNYSKDGLIKPVKGKKYAKEHIVQMLLVYALKSSMSICEIKRMLTGVDDSENFTDGDLIACYDRYLDQKEDVRDMSRDVVERLLREQSLAIEDDRDFLVFLLSLIALSSYTNGIARALIAARYPDPEVLEKERKEKAKEKEEEERRQEKEKKKKDKDSKKSAADREADVAKAIEDDVGANAE